MSPVERTVMSSVQTVTVGKKMDIYWSTSPLARFRPLRLWTNVPREGVAIITRVMVGNRLYLDGPIDAYLYAYRRQLKLTNLLEKLKAEPIAATPALVDWPTLGTSERVEIKGYMTGKKPTNGSEKTFALCLAFVGLQEIGFTVFQ
jgi:hypothetical protein